ncbi:MAG: PfkB family carbohydrate kinase [Bacteroidales bacterium]
MIYTIGETVLDIILQEMTARATKPGGSALNTAVSLAELGNNVSFISELGTDKIGDYIINFLHSKNINTSHIVKHAHNTSLAIAHLDTNNDAQYEFYKPQPKSVYYPEIPIQQQDIVLFSSTYAIANRNRTALLRILKSAQDKNAIRIYDPNIRTQHNKKSNEYKRITENFTIANIVRASDEDCKSIFNTTTPHKVYSYLRKYNVSIFIMTRNKHKVDIITPQYSLQYPVPDIQPISTIGAGDTFNAGITHCLHHITNKYTETSISTIPQTFWDNAIPFAIKCATTVCMSYENYLTKKDNLKPANQA